MLWLHRRSLGLGLAILALAAGIGLGYLLRIIISLGRRGSMELDLKQMELRAREEAQKVIDEAETRARDIVEKAEDERLYHAFKRYREETEKWNQKSLDQIWQAIET